MKTNIPICRSYELDTANIIIGCYIKEEGYFMNNGKPDYNKPCTRHYIQDDDCNKHEIAPEYLSISFEDMIDSEGTKIFASLSEDGRGGDNLEILDCESSEYVAVYNKNMFSYGAKNVNPAEDEWYFESFYELDGDIKVTGIQQ